MSSADVPRGAPVSPEMLAYYGLGLEDERLDRDRGKLERWRTQELLARYLPPPPCVVLDVGGGTGRYAAWLAERGYTVHLIDPVPLHIEQARARSTAQPHAPLASISPGDARYLDWEADQANAVLLLGPLYHLTSREERLACLREAWRVLRPRGIVMAAAISRFASALDPGFEDVRVLAIEGPGWLLQDFDAQWSDEHLREIILEIVRRTESEPALLGASSHLMAIGSKPRGGTALRS